MAKIEIRARALPRENAVLRRLYFDTMYSREDTISMAESGTFKWMLGEQDAASSRSSTSGSVATDSQLNSEDEDEGVDDSRTDIAEPFSAPESEENPNQSSPSAPETEEPFPPPEGEQHLSRNPSLASEDQVDESSIVQASSPDPSPELDMREIVANSFLSFIEHGNGIFFISGKAGSGKSTLMKFLGDHDRVKALAESWAGEKTLVFAPFYFWNSGDRLQMSLEGFYRTILFKILQQCPEMAATLFPQEFNAHHTNDNFLGPFRIVELRAAMEILTNTTEFPSNRFCFFFDGMDEYEGDSLEHLQLARMFKSWASSSDIKIICSARPHEELMKAFADARVLVRLHELTKGDIHKFLISQLHRELIESGSEDKLEEYTSLVDDMVQMSDGVFLWAYLVMRSILSGIVHEDTTQTLRERMRSAPRELNDLFRKILSSVDPALQGRSRNMLLLAINDPFFNNIPAIAYSWLPDLQDDEFPFSSPMKPLSQEEVDTRLRIVRGQLSALTKGLLEMQTTDATDAYSKYTVGFMHRTVKDFLRNEDDWRRSASGGDLLSTEQPELYWRLWLAIEKFTPSRNLAGSFYTPYTPFFWIRTCPDYVIAPRILDAFCEIVDAANMSFNSKAHLGVRAHVSVEPFQLGKKRERSQRYFYYTAESISPIRCALFYNQSNYIMSKLKSKAFLNGHRAQLPRFLLIKSRELKPDVQFCKAMFDLGVVPSDEITMLEDQPPKPIWLVFLRTFLHDICWGPDCPETKAREFLVPIWLIFEEFLLRGADADVIFVLREFPPRPSPPPPGPRALLTRHDISVRQMEYPTYYLELEQLVDAFSPSNARSLRRLLSKRSTDNLWAKTSGFVSNFALWRSSAPSSMRDKYLPIETEWLSTRSWVPLSVMTKSHELADDFKYDIF